MVKEIDPQLTLKQENLYLNRNGESRILCNRRWYRKLYGGNWKLLKFKGVFYPIYIWTNRSEGWRNFRVMKTEEYPQTRVNTRLEVYKEFFKQRFKLK